MKRQFILSALALLLAAICAPAAWAQIVPLKGSVVDTKGNPLAGATLHMVNMANGRKYDLKTDKNGNYYNVAIEYGTYDVQVTLDGKPILTTRTNITPGEVNVFNIDLRKITPSAQQPNQQAIEEQKKEAAKVEEENKKIRGLNERLAAAKTAQDAGNLQEAIAQVTQATQMDPTRDIIWGRLGDLELLDGKKQADATQKKEMLSKAAEHFKKASTIRPLGVYYNNAGEAYARLGDSGTAIQMYEQAVKSDPAQAGMYYFNEGAVLTNTGKVDEANAAFDKAIAADPNKADAYYQKGVNLLGKASIGKDGKMIAPPEAEKALAKYLELAPAGPNAQSAKELLATLGASIETSYGKSKTKKK
ncbi:MAG: carboxypeptidase regulatory-like domain-containing protein [Terriglobales bacterium]